MNKLDIFPFVYSFAKPSVVDMLAGFESLPTELSEMLELLLSTSNR